MNFDFSRRIRPGICTALLVLQSNSAYPAGVTLFSQSSLQAPVRAEPDGLLELAGFGFAKGDVVVYQSIDDDGTPSSVPPTVPPAATVDQGTASIASVGDSPYFIAIRLPKAISPQRSYTLWVRAPDDQWSAPVVVNNVRPLWVTPAFVYATASTAGLPRYLKIVGRNLDARDGESLRVRLAGPRTLTILATRTNTRLDQYVARITLPASLAPGRYQVAVSRDGIHWIETAEQPLEVRPDPSTGPEYRVSDPKFGGCRPDDQRDDTPCILQALRAASGARGGSVVFDAGSWNLIDGAASGVSSTDGILVPPGVSLRGMGATRTQIVRHREWGASRPTSGFTLLGANRVSGFTFRDSKAYTPSDQGAAFLQLGGNSDRFHANDKAPVQPIRNFEISENVFDRTYSAIADGGQPLAEVFIANNEFGSYKFQLELGGNRYNMTDDFRLEDSVIGHNTFEPGSYMDAAIRQGSIASEIGGSRRLDFSENAADGASAKYLNATADARGWRAAHFWHMKGNHEMLLISQNIITCSGDKDGDGEAIALDNNENTHAFPAMRLVLAADRDRVTVAGPLLTRQLERDISPSTFYIGHWIQIGDGPGMGQARKIVSYSVDDRTGNVTFVVSPQWDVSPSAQVSRISVGREFWQAYVVGNRIDHRAPPCLKSNRTRKAGGEISIWAQTADSVVDGNEQYDTDGIVFEQSYQPPEHPCPDCGAATFYQSFLEVRGNLVDGTYDPSTDCNPTGILASVSAAPWGDTPPTLGFGVAIAGNRLVRADNAVGGAISVSRTWWGGPEPEHWPLMRATVIDHNTIIDRGAADPVRNCNNGHGRVGIGISAESLTSDTTFYANTCVSVPVPLGPTGQNVAVLCPLTPDASCECSSRATGH